MKEIGSQFENKDYDLYFEWTDEKIYCSELVWKIFKQATRIDVVFIPNNGININPAPILPAKAPKELKKAAILSETYIIDAPVLANGKFELLHYIKEISITYEYHRYGNFGIKESEMRRPITWKLFH